RNGPVKYLPRVLHYLRPYWYLAVVSVALIAIGAAAGVFAPWAPQVLVGNVLQSRPVSALLGPLLGAAAHNRVSPAGGGGGGRGGGGHAAAARALGAGQLCQHQDPSAHGARFPERPVSAFPAPVARISRSAPLGDAHLRHQLAGGCRGPRRDDDSPPGPERA